MKKQYDREVDDLRDDLLKSVREGNDEKFDKTMLRLMEKKDEAAAEHDIEKELKIHRIIREGHGERTHRDFSRVKDKEREKARFMDIEELERESNDLIFGDVYQDEINRRELLKEKENQRYQERISSINLDTILKIVDMCRSNEISVIEDGTINNRTFHIFLKNVSNKNVSLNISCSNGRCLKINMYFDSEEVEWWGEISKRYTTKLSFGYSCLGKSIYFAGTDFDNSYSLIDPEFDAENFIKVLTPVTLTGNQISWNCINKYRKIMFTKEELEFIVNMLDKAIDEEQERQDDAEAIKQKVLKLSTEERKRLLNNLK